MIWKQLNITIFQSHNALFKFPPMHFLYFPQCTFLNYPQCSARQIWMNANTMDIATNHVTILQTGHILAGVWTGTLYGTTGNHATQPTVSSLCPGPFAPDSVALFALPAHCAPQLLLLPPSFFLLLCSLPSPQFSRRVTFLLVCGRVLFMERPEILQRYQR